MTRVCVYCGSGAGASKTYERAARELGRVMSQRGFGLVYGGASVGLMGIVADAVLELGGEVIGVIPDALVAKEVAHEGLTERHVTRNMHQRKATMASLSDAFVALPGGLGTMEELFETWTWGQLGFHRKPCGLLNVSGYFDRLLSFLDHSVNEGFVRAEHREMLVVEADPERLLVRLGEADPPSSGKWADRPDLM